MKYLLFTLVSFTAGFSVSSLHKCRCEVQLDYYSKGTKQFSNKKKAAFYFSNFKITDLRTGKRFIADSIDIKLNP